ncbi:hypothetical protein [Seonamhaeicola sp.]|uniref:hypothetical protein n=1 Tax=Seonamhaeicola sp. TaxID=1912245 RepID=UPI0026172A83|nr:hypothetical protein [Seonamhaeicola sp.]
MNHSEEHILIQKCLQRIEEKLNWGDASEWHNDVFNELSETIQQKTRVLLSPTTLKRIWGKVSYKGNPSISTLNTLSQFIDYQNWRDFKNAHSKVNRPKKAHSKTLIKMPLVFGLAAGLALVFITLYSSVTSKKDPISLEDIEKIKFSSKPIATGMPNSVVFDFDLTLIKSDSIYIQQYWDPTKTIKLKKGQKQATGIYYFPGYFRAKLLVDNNVIKEHDLFIKSDGWSASIDYDPIPKYLEKDQFINQGLFLDSLLISEISSSQTPVISTFHFIEDLGAVSGDNFTLETTLKNTYRDKWAVCETINIYLIGSKGAIIIPFTIPGCVSNINVMLNDVFLNGKEQDLSAFGSNFSTFKDIKISIENKLIKVYIDNKEIYSGTYNRSMGKLVGLRYKFLGAGEVKDLSITDKNGNVIIKNNFQ